jgi:hypothetical protein
MTVNSKGPFFVVRRRADDAILLLTLEEGREILAREHPPATDNMDEWLKTHANKIVETTRYEMVYTVPPPPPRPKAVETSLEPPVMAPVANTASAVLKDAMPDGGVIVEVTNPA